MNKNNKNIIFLTGHSGSGKISKYSLQKLQTVEICGTGIIWKNTKDESFDILQNLINDPSILRVFIIPLYIEDRDKNNRGFVNLDYAKEIGEFIKEKDKNKKCEIFHPYESGKIIGNKIETNKLFTNYGIPCPIIITSPKYDTPIFVNDVGGSCSPLAGAKPNAFDLDQTKYNTELIDTTYEYQGKTYYVSPRAMCIGGEISHFIIKCRSTEQNDRVVRFAWDVTYAEATGIQYDFFKTQIVPDYEYLLSITKNIEKILGFGAYSYDLLKDVKNNKWYISEAGFKFDSSKSIRKSPYSLITYRQIQKEVYGKIFENDAEMEAFEKVPLDRPYLDKFGVLTKEEYHQKSESVFFWSKMMFKKYFEKIYTDMKAEAKANGTWEDI